MDEPAIVNQKTQNVVSSSIYDFKRKVSNNRSIANSIRLSSKGVLPLTVAGSKLHVISPEITRASLGRLSSARIRGSMRRQSTVRHACEGGKSSTNKLSQPDVPINTNRTQPDQASVVETMPTNKQQRDHTTPTVEDTTQHSAQAGPKLTPDISGLDLTSQDQTFADNTHSQSNLQVLKARKLTANISNNETYTFESGSYILSKDNSYGNFKRLGQMQQIVNVNSEVKIARRVVKPVLSGRQSASVKNMIASRKRSHSLRPETTTKRMQQQINLLKDTYNSLLK